MILLSVIRCARQSSLWAPAPLFPTASFPNRWLEPAQGAVRREQGAGLSRLGPVQCAVCAIQHTAW